MKEQDKEEAITSQLQSLRDSKQQEVIDLYLEKKPSACSLELSTGFGKSKVVIEIIKALQCDSVVIWVNDTHLRDNSWRSEFEKWGMLDFYNNHVTMATYQSAYKWIVEDSKEVFKGSSLIIADEADFAAATDSYSNAFYTFLGVVPILAVTGFITEGKRSWFRKHLPILYRYTAAQAQQDKVLNSIKYVFVRYNLSLNSNDVTVEYKQGSTRKSFTQSENAAYLYASEKLVKAQINSSKIEADFVIGNISMRDYRDKKAKADRMLQICSNNRAGVLLKSKASAAMARKLIDYTVSENPESKVVVFSKRTEQSTNICGSANVIHAKRSKEDNIDTFDQFCHGDRSLLGVCKKLNRGANVDRLDTAIFESYYGSDTEAAQQLGRLMRLNAEEEATAYVLLPYYMHRCDDGTYESRETQQVVWANKMLKETTIINSVVWDYR